MANLIWSGSFPATSIATKSLSPAFLTMVRLFVGGLVLFPFVIHSFKVQPKIRSFRALTRMIVLGLGGFALPVTLESTGIRVSSPALGAVSIALEPLFTVLLASLFLRQKLTMRGRVAMFIAAVGAWVVGGCPRPGVAGFLLGDILLVIAVFCYAFYNAFSSNWIQDIPATAATSIMLLAGGFGCLPFWLATGHVLPHHLSLNVLVATLFLAFFATAGAYLIWVVVLQDQNVASASISLYLQPIFGVILSMLIVHTRPTMFFYVGAVMILFALYLGRKGKNKRVEEKGIQSDDKSNWVNDM